MTCQERLKVANQALAARDRTIQVLMDRLQDKQRKGGEAYSTFEQNVVLQQVVARKTRELEDRNRSLAEAHDELKRTQERLMEACKLEAMGELAAGIAHELNTPLQYVTDNFSFVSDALSKVLEIVDAAVRSLEADADEGRKLLRAALSGAGVEFLREELPEALQDAAQGLERVTSLVRAMRRFSHPSGDVKQPVNFQEVVQTVLAVSRNEWKYVADVDVQLEPGLPLVPCFADELSQALINLVVNAAHAIGDLDDRSSRGMIQIQASQTQGQFEIRVKDSGRGIPPELQQRIFEPFYTTKPPGKGTGQGLALVRSVVAKHGGKVCLDPSHGPGACFVITLPLA